MKQFPEWNFYLPQFLEQFDECFVPQVLAFNASVRAGQPLEVRSDSEEEEVETDQAKSDDNNNEEYDWKREFFFL